jgi:hypothetical protein
MAGQDSVVVITGQVARLTISLHRGAGILRVESSPPSANVKIDGHQRGVTPLLLPQMRAGPTTVKITLKGHRPHLENIIVPQNGRQELSVQLAPRPPPGEYVVGFSLGAACMVAAHYHVWSPLITWKGEMILLAPGFFIQGASS